MRKKRNPCSSIVRFDVERRARSHASQLRVDQSEREIKKIKKYLSKMMKVLNDSKQ